MKFFKFLSWVLMFLSCTTFASEYEAIVSPRNFTYQVLEVVYEGNSQEELEAEVKSTLDKTLLFENVKLSHLNSKSLSKIEKDRNLFAGIIDVVKNVMTIKGLAKKFTTKTMTDSQMRQATLETVAAALEIVNKELAKRGLIFPSNKDLEGVVSVIVQNIATILQNDFTNKLTDVDAFSMALNTTAALVDVKATIEVNDFLYYQLSAPIVDAYIRYYAEFLTGPSAKYVNGRLVKLMSLEEFINNRYYRATSSIDKPEIVSRSQYKEFYGEFPESIHSLRNAVSSQGIIVKATDYQSFKDYLLSFPSIYVGSLIDISTRVIEPFKFTTLLTHMRQMVSNRLSLLRLPMSGYPILRLSISDNLVIDSTRESSQFFVAKEHAISNLSNYHFWELKPSGSFSAEMRCKDYASFEDEGVFINAGVTGMFNTANCDSLDSVSFNFKFNNNVSWQLFDEFQVENRYVGDDSNHSKLIEYVANIKKHQIYFNDQNRQIDVNRQVTQKEFYTVISKFMDGHNYFHRLPGFNDSDSRLWEKMTQYRDENKFLTYVELFEVLHSYLTLMYPEVNDNFWMKNGFPIFPSNSSNLDIYLNRQRATARKIDPLNYIKYVENLSQAGVITTEVAHVIKKLDEPIVLKDYLKYLSNLIDLLNIKQGGQ